MTSELSNFARSFQPRVDAVSILAQAMPAPAMMKAMMKRRVNK